MNYKTQEYMLRAFKELKYRKKKKRKTFLIVFENIYLNFF